MVLPPRHLCSDSHRRDAHRIINSEQDQCLDALDRWRQCWESIKRSVMHIGKQWHRPTPIRQTSTPVGTPMTTDFGSGLQACSRLVFLYTCSFVLLNQHLPPLEQRDWVDNNKSFYLMIYISSCLGAGK